MGNIGSVFLKGEWNSEKGFIPNTNYGRNFDALRSAKSTSKIDLRSAYHQIPLEEESRKIKAFIILGNGMYVSI